jgi:flagellar hook-length control protein FliK
MASAARVAFPVVAVGPGLPDGTLPVLSGAAVRDPALAASSAMSDATQALMAQIVKAARLAWTQRSGEARLTVHAGGALGEVQVTLHVSRGQVWAALQADRATAAQVLDGARGDLQRALAGHGLDLHRFAVSVHPDGRRRGAPEDNRWARPARSRHGNLRFEDFA